MPLRVDDVVGSMSLTPEDRDKYLAAGLPLPIYTRRDMKATDPRSTIERFQYDAQVGSFVHLVLGEVVEQCLTLDASGRARLVNETVARNIDGVPGLGRGDKAHSRIATLASQYLTHFLPPRDSTFVGAEVGFHDGRVDLAWYRRDLGTWFDEIKTWRGVGELIDDSTLRQVYKYLDHGIDAYGDDFLGVRLIPLGHLRNARLIRPDGAHVPLASLDLFGPRKETA